MRLCAHLCIGESSVYFINDVCQLNILTYSINDLMTIQDADSSDDDEEGEEQGEADEDAEE